MKISKELLKKLPKAELHCHLDGSLRVSTILELAAQLVSSSQDAMRQIGAEHRMRKWKYI